MDIVQDTNVFVAALRKGGGASAIVLDRCLSLKDQAFMGAALYAEYEELISREIIWGDVPVSREEREMLLDSWNWLLQGEWSIWSRTTPGTSSVAR